MDYVHKFKNLSRQKTMHGDDVNKKKEKISDLTKTRVFILPFIGYDGETVNGQIGKIDRQTYV